jgi:ribosome-associated translation inhibitor RaiA
MQTPVHIAFHGLDKSDAVETRIQEKVAKLEHYFDRITSCRVTVEHLHRSRVEEKVKDQPFHISIFLGVPGDELVVRRDPKDPSSLKGHEDIQIALRDAFATMERRLKDYVQRRWRKAHHGAASAMRNGEDAAS